MKLFSSYGLVSAWVISLIATGTSLWFSEIMHLPPCSLCWYQRILMYPLVIILGIGLARRDKEVWRYALPFSIIGMVIGLYHTLLQAGLVSQTGVCTSPVSCTAIYINWFGFLTIPLMSLIAFTLITALVVISSRSHKK